MAGSSWMRWLSPPSPHLEVDGSHDSRLCLALQVGDGLQHLIGQALDLVLPHPRPCAHQDVAALNL
eukprot:scaffold653501_cov86-Prasinocladus_malaysianus.AAC.1